MKAPSE